MMIVPFCRESVNTYKVGFLVEMGLFGEQANHLFSLIWVSTTGSFGIFALRRLLARNMVPPDFIRAYGGDRAGAWAREVVGGMAVILLEQA